jgi:hypothetical protein
MHILSFVFDGNVFTITITGKLRDGRVFNYGVLPYQESHEANFAPQVEAMLEKNKQAERRSN